MDPMTLSFCIRGLLIRCFDSFCQFLVDKEREEHENGQPENEQLDKMYQIKVVDTLLKALEDFSKN